MNKIATFATVIAISFVATVGGASAATAKSPAEFNAMVSAIQTKQELQRKDLMQKIQIVNTMKANKTRPGKKINLKFLSMLERIKNKQANNRMKIMQFVNNNLKKQPQVASSQN